MANFKPRWGMAAVLMTVVCVVSSLVSVPVDASAIGQGTTVLSMASTYDPAYSIGRQHSGAGSEATVSRATLGGGIVMTGKSSRVGANDALTFAFTPAEGKSLTLGRYVIDAGSKESNLARVEISVGNVGYKFRGDVEVLDIAADAAGNVTRFDIAFRNGPESPSHALFGQVRMGQSSDVGGVLGTTTVQFPDTPVGSLPIWVHQEVTNFSASALRVGRSTVTNGAATDFRLGRDSCADTLLAPGDSCSLEVGFVPTKGGPRTGIVTIPVGGTAKTFSVAGNAPLGTTTITYAGDDYVSGSATHSFSDGPYATVVQGSASGGWTFTPTRPYGLDADAETAAVTLVKYDGKPIQPGSFNTSGPIGPEAGSSAKHGLSVTGNGRGCGAVEGEVAVASFQVDSTGAPVSAQFSWTLKCKFQTGTMTGSLRWRDRIDKSSPAPATDVRLTSLNGVKTVTWAGSTSKDSTNAIARIVSGPGAGALPTSGLPLTRTSATSAVMPRMIPGRTYTVSVWAIDSAGNTGAPRSIAVSP